MQNVAPARVCCKVLLRAARYHLRWCAYTRVVLLIPRALKTPGLHWKHKGVTMRRTLLACTFISALAAGSAFAQTAAITPLYDGSSGSLQSYLRLYNAGEAPSTFTVRVVDTTSGTTLGAASLAVPAGASVQYPVAAGANAIYTLAGVAAGGTKALYVENADPLAGYQHVSFNTVSALFENNSVCRTSMSQQLAAQGRQALTNVHSSRFAGTYPSAVTLHNSASAPTSVQVTARDAATGTALGQINRTIGAHGTATIAPGDVEAALGIATPPLHYNLEVSGAAAPVALAHTIGVAQLGGEVNMSEICAVNAIEKSAAPAALPTTVPTAYCGTFRYPSGYTYLVPAPYYNVTHQLLVSVAPNGAVRGIHTSTDRDVKAGGTISGNSDGTAVTITTSDGIKGSGTIQGNAISGTFQHRTGNVAFTASTGACN